MTETCSLIDSRTAADLLGLKPHTLAVWRTRGVGPAFTRLSRRSIRYRRADVEAWADARRVEHDEAGRPAEAIDGR